MKCKKGLAYVPGVAGGSYSDGRVRGGWWLKRPGPGVTAGEFPTVLEPD
jgi:hypothetical protein